MRQITNKLPIQFGFKVMSSEQKGFRGEVTYFPGLLCLFPHRVLPSKCSGLHPDLQVNGIK